MKILLSALIALLPATAFAQSQAGRVGISARLGGADASGDRSVTDRAKFGFWGGGRLSYGLNDYWSLIGDLDFMQMQGNTGIAAQGYTFGARYSPLTGQWRPALSLGIGALSVENMPTKNGQATLFNVKLGAALDYAVNADWLFGPELAFHLGSKNGHNTHATQVYNIGVALTHLFGRRGERPTRPVRAAAPTPAPRAQPAAAPKTVEISLEVEFETAQDIVRPQYRARIQKVADFMSENPGATAVIEGHTDSRGNRDYNIDLSQRRADAVRRYLIQEFGVASGRLSAKGYGPDRPIDTNDTDAGRQKNRRVVASITSN